jgi:hypothetical protein
MAHFRMGLHYLIPSGIQQIPNKTVHDCGNKPLVEEAIQRLITPNVFSDFEIRVNPVSGSLAAWATFGVRHIVPVWVNCRYLAGEAHSDSHAALSRALSPLMVKIRR